MSYPSSLQELCGFIVRTMYELSNTILIINTQYLFVIGSYYTTFSCIVEPYKVFHNLSKCHKNS